MSHRLLLTSLFITSLTTGAIGCVDLNQSDGCTSDSQCRYERVCDEMTGQCVNPQAAPGTIDNPDADTGTPDTAAPPDVAPTPDVGPEPDGWSYDPDVPSDPDVGPDADAGLDADVYDAAPCRVHAQARARVQGDGQWQDNLSATALDTVRFDASQSEGDIIRYHWTILAHPQGSTQRLMPSASGPSTRLFIDLVGAYRVELTVVGQSASGEYCEDTDMVTISPNLTDDMHIQLTWDTPGDPDQTDTTGADLDLHYLHPNGRFGNPPWDIFWPNPTADWGVQGDSTDDPTLGIDDTDGAGPENITHNDLEMVDYEIGVYLTNHENFGTSYATVRVYHRGQLIFERENRQLVEPGDFWHVAKVNGNGTVTPIDEVLDGYPFL